MSAKPSNVVPLQPLTCWPPPNAGAAAGAGNGIWYDPNVPPSAGNGVFEFYGYPWPQVPQTADSILWIVKARAATLRADLAAIDAKRAELEKLERMIAAAEAK